MSLCHWVLWFFSYSVLGWIYETTFCSIQAGHFINRGFSYGPYLPIYGFGALFLLILLHKTTNKIHQFFISMTVTTALEYITSYLLEMIFHRTWWSYTNYRLQLHGRICLLAALLFGILGVLLLNYIHPKIKKLTDKVSKKVKIILAFSFTIILLTDFIFSFLRAFQ